ncbi:MAG: thiol reductant ABC exporter subunit CydD [Hyphomonas sp.]|uniref:thiol reductant ABC exporter subunit CydD n=1 Tax=Hyphomonas sp. TaxID=87 RepID=UPI0035285190
MSEPRKRHPDSPAKQSLQRWNAHARDAQRLVLMAQLTALLGWIAVAWGIGHSVGASSLGAPDNTGLLIAASGALVRAGANWAADTFAAAAGRAMTSAARQELFSTLTESGAGWLAGADAGTRTAQIVDRTGKLWGYAARWLPGTRLAAIGPLVILVAIASQSWVAALLLFLCLAVTPLFFWLTTGETISRARTQQAALDHLAGSFQARAAQSGLIRAFRAVGRETAYLKQAAEDLREGTMSILRIAFLSTAVLEFFSSISIALVAVYVGFKLLGVFPFETGETLTLAQGLTALILAPEFFAPIRKLPGLHHDRADATAAGEILSGWLSRGNAQTVHRLPLRPSPPVITFQEASLGWPGHAPVLAGVSFAAAPGKLTILSGPSGSGKSTCLLSLIGRAQVSGGAVDVAGKPLSAGDSLADSVAFLGQTPWLMEGTIRDNIAIAAPGAPDDEIASAAERAGVLAFAAKADGGLDRRLARFGAGLSGGQRQRIALARALLRKSPILLMDEPTAHLDPDAEEDFIQKIRALSQTHTVLVASHSPALIAAADQVIQVTAFKVEATV